MNPHVARKKIYCGTEGRVRWEKGETCKEEDERPERKMMSDR
jgi:hypothetical protein